MVFKSIDKSANIKIIKHAEWAIQYTLEIISPSPEEWTSILYSSCEKNMP